MLQNAQNPTVVITVLEIALFVWASFGFGWICCDFFWTSIKSDEAAQKHFLKINTKRLLSYAAFGILAVIALLGWIW